MLGEPSSRPPIVRATEQADLRGYGRRTRRSTPDSAEMSTSSTRIRMH